MKRYNRSQFDQSEVLDNCYYMKFTLVASALKIMLLQFSLSLVANSTKHGSCLLKGNKKPGEKPHNLIKEIEKENWETNENVVAL